MNAFSEKILLTIFLCGLSAHAISANTKKMDLSTLLNIALQTNTAIKARLADVESSKEEISSAVSQFFPTPAVQAQRREDQHDVTLSLTQPVWTGGKLTAGLDYARAQFRVSQSQLDEQRFQVLQQIIRAWGTWQSSFHAQQIEKNGIGTLTALREMMDKRANSGLASEADLTLVNARLMQARSEYTRDTKDMDNALQQLTLLVGYSFPSDYLSSDINVGSVSDIHLVNAIERTLATNPTVRRSNDQIQIANSEIKKEKAMLLPTVNVKWEIEDTDSPYSPYRHDNRVSLNVEQSFGAGLSGYSNIESAVAKKESAIHDKNYSKQSAINNVANDIHNYKSALEDTKDVKVYQLAIAKTLASYQRMFLAGKRDWLDVLNILNENISAQKELVNANVQLVTAGWLVKLDCGEIPWN